MKSLQEILLALEQRSISNYGEASDFLRSQEEEVDEHDLENFQREKVAFLFFEREDNDDGSPFFRPFYTARGPDGTEFQVPDASKITEVDTSYWKRRATESASDTLRSRYTGLVVEFEELATGKKVDHKVVLAYIESLRRSSKCPSLNGIIRRDHICRALEFALRMKSKHIGEVARELVDLEREIGLDKYRGLWGFAFTKLIREKPRALKHDHELRTLVLDDLAARFKRLSTSNDQPSSLLDVADMLASENISVDGANPIEAAAERVLELAMDIDPFVASGWLNQAAALCEKYGMSAPRGVLLERLRLLGPEKAKRTKTVSASTTIDREELKEFFEALLAGGAEQACVRIAVQFLQRVEDLEAELVDLRKSAPLSFLIPRKVMSPDGIPVCTILDPEADLDGNLINHQARQLQVSAFFLREGLSRLLDGDEGVQALENVFSKSPVFGDNALLLADAIGHLRSERPMEACFLLSAALERGLRKLAQLASVNTLERNKVGGFGFKSVGGLLFDKLLVAVLSEDVAFYLRGLLVDQRGWNLRNNISHGLVTKDGFQMAHADRLFHACLVLCLFQKADENDSGDNA